MMLYYTYLVSDAERVEDRYEGLTQEQRDSIQVPLGMRLVDFYRPLAIGHRFPISGGIPVETSHTTSIYIFGE